MRPRRNYRKSPLQGRISLLLFVVLFLRVFTVSALPAPAVDPPPSDPDTPFGDDPVVTISSRFGGWVSTLEAVGTRGRIKSAIWTVNGVKLTPQRGVRFLNADHTAVEINFLKAKFILDDPWQLDTTVLVETTAAPVGGASAGKIYPFGYAFPSEFLLYVAPRDYDRLNTELNVSSELGNLVFNESAHFYRFTSTNYGTARVSATLPTATLAVFGGDGELDSLKVVSSGVGSLEFSVSPGNYYVAVDDQESEWALTTQIETLCDSCGPTDRSNTKPGYIVVTGEFVFGNVPVGSSVQRTVNLENRSTTPVTFSGVSFPSGFSADWRDGIIPAGGSKAVTVTFAPETDAFYFNLLEFDFDNASPLQVTAYGNGILPEKGASGLQLSGDKKFKIALTTAMATKAIIEESTDLKAWHVINATGNFSETGLFEMGFDESEPAHFFRFRSE
jgi:hypothetical protein